MNEDVWTIARAYMETQGVPSTQEQEALSSP
jgi:hypothetical protein